MLMTVVCWGFNFVALKLLFAEGLTPAATSLVRFLLMWGVLAAICRLRKEPLSYPEGSTIALWTLGFLSMGVYMILFLEGMARTTAAEGAIVLATSPVLTALVAVAMKRERFVWGALLGAVVAFIGVFLVVFAGDQNSHGTLLGNGLVLLSSLVWAYCAVQTRIFLDDMSPLRALTLSMPGALPILLVYGLAATLAVPWSDFTWVGWAMLAHITLLAGVVGFLGFFAGVRQVGSSGAMLYQFLVPPIAAFFAWALLKQPLLPQQGVGLVVVLAGVWWSTRSRLTGVSPASEMPSEAEKSRPIGARSSSDQAVL